MGHLHITEITQKVSELIHIFLAISFMIYMRIQNLLKRNSRTILEIRKTIRVTKLRGI